MVLSYAIVGVIVFFTMLALGEMAAFMPIAGVSFSCFGRHDVELIVTVLLHLCRPLRRRLFRVCPDMELLVQRCCVDSVRSCGATIGLPILEHELPRMGTGRLFDLPSGFLN